MIQLPTVAKKVYYACTKCEADRYQVVLAHTSAITAKLECEVCKTKNTFRLEEPKRTRTAIPKKPTAKSTKSKASAHVAKWTQLRDNNAEKPTAYNMKKAFEVGTPLEHPKFGIGFVINVNNQAIQVVFEDEERQLVHNRQ
jgi:hypothetical protein